jgi:hypothetical protein
MRLDQPFGDQVVDRVHHEERIALGPLMDERNQLRGKLVGGEPDREVLPHSGLCEVFERQFLALLPRDEFLLHRLERVPAGNQLRRPVGPDQHQVSRPTASGDIGDQVQRRVVAPVKVLQHEHERRVGRQGIQRITHFAQHPLARGARRVAAEQFAVCGRHQRGQLHQPHRRVHAQHVDDARILPAQLPDRVQDRQIRFAHPVLRQTLAAADPHVRIGDHAARKRFEQRRLADAGLPSRTPPAPPRRAPASHPCIRDSVVLATHEPGRHVRWWQAPGRRNAIGRTLLRRRGLHASDFTDEPVPATVGRFDEAGGLRIVRQRLANLADGDFEHRIADKRVPPDRANEVLFGHELRRESRCSSTANALGLS